MVSKRPEDRCASEEARETPARVRRSASGLRRLPLVAAVGLRRCQAFAKADNKRRRVHERGTY